MATPLPAGVHITVERRKFGPDYDMPSMEMATDHYSIGYPLSGDRRIVTPTGTYSYHAGEAVLQAPFVYHRSISDSGVPYERILIKYTPEFVMPFIQNVGRRVLDELYEKKVFCFSEETSAKVKTMFLDMEREYRKERPYKEFVLQGMLFRLLTAIWEEGSSKEREFHGTPLTPPIIDAVSYIESFYSESPSLERTAGAVNLSPSYFSRLFHEQLGKAYSEYLNEVKLRYVNVLLAQTDKTVMEIAQETGFCHGNYLIGQFKKKTGMTPGQFRKNSRQKKL